MAVTRAKLAVVLVLLATAQIATAGGYKPSSDGKDVFLNLHIASECIKGYSTATFFASSDPLTADQIEHATNMAKSVCIDDSLVISIYNSIKNGPDSKTLDESRAYAEKIIEGWMAGNLETLRTAR